TKTFFGEPKAAAQDLHQQTSAQQPTGANRAVAAAASREPKEQPVPTREPPSRRGSQIEQLHSLGAADQRTQQSSLPQSRVAATTTSRRLEKNRKQQHSVADRRKTSLLLRSIAPSPSRAAVAQEKEKIAVAGEVLFTG
ncbi:hypothetical protein HAX54_049851, partial [Datura stramonium]|nr:hypothetical protein [Datura stramonium]